MFVARSRGSKAAALTLAALCCALFALALPALASAQDYLVNSVNDGEAEGLPGECVTSTVGECTLRAAIEAANENGFFPDRIEFDTSVFEGNAGQDEIEPATPLPAITEPLLILGAECALSGIFRPCAGITAPSGGAALTVESDQVSVVAMAVGGGKYGIDVLNESLEFTAAADWIGVKLDTGDNGSETAGIFLDPGSDGALIGGEGTDGERNVIGHNGVGVYVDGASNTKIRGNYIGVEPTGAENTSQPVGVRIVDSKSGSGFKAEDNEVGGVLTTTQAETGECVGRCNVIATSNGGRAIDLGGVNTDTTIEAASGPTSIRGNFIGLSADGGSVIHGAQFGVLASPPTGGGGTRGPGKVTVGGLPQTESNYIEGGEFGIYMEKGEGFEGAGNFIGLSPTGPSEGPSQAGIFLYSEGLTEPATAAANSMALGPDAVGVESRFTGAAIEDNEIQGSETAIRTLGANEGQGNLIQGNEVSDSDIYGIEILNQSNELLGNTVQNSGRSGIYLDGDPEHLPAPGEPNHNVIGGDTGAEENEIDGSERAAIEIQAVETSRNLIAANRGAGNEEAFISLVRAEHEETNQPNGGIRPPSFATVFQSSASGTAQPNATVRLFRKATTDAGEIESFLGVAIADASGNWKANFPTVPVGTLVAATQTSSDGGTSEVSAPLKADVDPVPTPTPSGGGGGTPPAPLPPPPPPAATAPTVKLTKKPKARSSATTAKFKFTANPAAGASFECKLDKGKFAKCKPPKTYKRLKPGKHSFQVRAVGTTGLKSKPATFKFTVTE